MFSKTIDLEENIILKNRIPILVNDENWSKIFGGIEDKVIQSTKDELEELLKEQKKAEREIARLQKEKVKAMKMILNISDIINNKEKVESADLLDQYKDKIYLINEKIDGIQYRLEAIPQEIRDTNFRLLEATVKYGYRELKEKKNKLEKIAEEIEELKERLRESINEKHDYEEWINSTYTFLHGMLGNEEMERLDDEILE
jgi:predicted RND superfamily exporter protein